MPFSNHDDEYVYDERHADVSYVHVQKIKWLVSVWTIVDKKKKPVL